MFTDLVKKKVVNNSKVDGENERDFVRNIGENNGETKNEER